MKPAAIPRIPWRIFLSPILLSLTLAAPGPRHAAAEDAPPAEARWFAPARSVAEYVPKGPSHCRRLFNVDWSWVGRREDQLPEFLSQADPARFADFCQSIHLDGTIVMAVPHHGYCTYETKIGTRFPGMKGDWFGRTIAELHQRKIAAFGYVTLNWNWKYMRDNEGRDFIHSKRNSDGSMAGAICLNAPGYLELVEGYTREVLQRYPVDGMRWDILHTPHGCTCAGCKALYRRLHGRELVAWDPADWRGQWEFYFATTGRAVQRLTKLCKGIKPSVEIWQNGFRSHVPNDLDLGRTQDVGYDEFGDPFRLLFLQGVLRKDGNIIGSMLESPRRRLCMALGGCGYSYYGHLKTNYRTLLPGDAMMDWHRREVAPFYRMIAEIQPYLEGARPVSHVGVLFSEATRVRYHYDRGPYLKEIERLVEAYLARSQPLEIVNCLDLGDRARLARLKLLVAPLTSGLTAAQLDDLRGFVRRGGTLLVAGDALRHDARGAALADFALADEMGVRFQGDCPDFRGSTGHRGADAVGVGTKMGLSPSHDAWTCHPVDPQASKQFPLPRDLKIASLVRVEAAAGQTPIVAQRGGQRCPLVHIRRLGEGRIVWLATLDSPELTRVVVDRLAGPPPIAVSPPEKQAILTHQEKTKRWVLHLMSDGPYTVDIHRDHTKPTRPVAQYPRDGWTAEVSPTATGLRVKASGAAKARLLVLE